MTRSFVAREIAKRSGDVRRVTAKDSTGRWASYVVLVHRHRMKAFEAACEAGKDLDLEEYGHVLMSCYGRQLTAEMLQTLKDEYGVDYPG